MKNINFLLSYLHYLLIAKFSKPVHSPFLSQLTDEIISDKREFYAFDEIESLKHELFNNAKTIQVEDHGAGPRNIPSNVRKISDITRSTSIPPKYGKLIFRLANHFQPKNILELGTGIGISTLYLASPVKHNKVLTIEGCPEIAKLARINFDKMNIQNILLLEGKFKNKLPEALDNLKAVDLVFIDGDHRKERLLQYFNTCLKYIHEDSIIIVDDINWSKEMKQGWKQLSRHPSVTLSVNHFRLGILFFKKDLQKQQATLFY